MAHIGKERRFELVGLQGTVTCGNQGFLRILVTLDALAYSNTMYGVSTVRPS